MPLSTSSHISIVKFTGRGNRSVQKELNTVGKELTDFPILFSGGEACLSELSALTIRHRGSEKEQTASSPETQTLKMQVS